MEWQCWSMKHLVPLQAVMQIHIAFQALLGKQLVVLLLVEDMLPALGLVEDLQAHHPKTNHLANHHQLHQ